MSTYVITANNIQELGGAQKVAHTLARGFAERGHEVHLIGVTPVENPHEYPQIPGVSVHTLMPEMWPVKSRSNTAYRTELRDQAVKAMAHILSTCESARIIATQVWSLEIVLDALPGDLAARQAFPLIGQYHGSFAAAASGRDIRRIQKLAPQCDYFAVLSVEDARAFADAGLTNVIALSNPSSLTAEQIAHVRNIERGKTIEFIGRLSAEKGPDLLLEAWEVAHPMLVGESWRLRFTGDGPMKDQLHGVADQSVSFDSPVTDVAPVIAGAGVVVIPSRTEGAPLILAEALALGTPVVVTDVSSGIREMVRDRSGAILIPSEDTQALAAAIVQATRLVGQSSTEISSTELINDSAIYEQWEQLFTGGN